MTVNIAMILAGGVGSRVGAKVPKQFIKILDKPVLAYTIAVFENHPRIDAIEIVCIKEYMEYLEKIVKQENYNKVRWIVEGGDTFQHSVYNGIKKLRGQTGSSDIVSVHYGAAPFVSEEIITDSIRIAEEKGNGVSATPCYSLLGTKDHEAYSSHWVDREQYMQLNSPQSFRFDYIDELYKKAEKCDLIDKVEPHTTSLMYEFGDKIYFSKGDQTNIKITTKEDLLLFKAFALLQQEGERAGLSENMQKMTCDN